MSEPTKRNLPTVLYIVALVLACACVSGGVVIWQQHRADEQVATDSPETLPPTPAEAARYGDVTRAAEATAEALLNIDYRDPQASFDAVAETATGTFLDQYQASSDSLVELVTQYESVQTGQVDSAAVSRLDSDDASVLVAATATVTNLQTGEDGQLRVYRILITLVHQDDAWLTDDLEFV
ncbi:hypothetical protein BH09ACT12_BH09ACT12_15370 [soil metagenome]